MKSKYLVGSRLSELLGEKTLDIDKFHLSIGVRKSAQDTWDSDFISDEDKSYLQAYADGINDYLDGVGYFKED